MSNYTLSYLNILAGLSQSVGEVLLTVMAERVDGAIGMETEDGCEVLAEDTLLVRLMKSDRKMWKGKLFILLSV